MPPSTVADMMIYLAWTMDGRGAQEGRTALSAPGGGTRVGERLTDLRVDAVLRSGRARSGVRAVRGDDELLGDGCRCSTTGWTSGGSTGSATG